MVVGNNESTTTKNQGELLVLSIAMQIRQYNVGHRSHWMPPLVDCMRRIAPAAAMVNKFE